MFIIPSLALASGLSFRYLQLNAELIEFADELVFKRGPPSCSSLSISTLPLGQSFRVTHYWLYLILLFHAEAYDSYYPSRYLSAENTGLKTELLLRLYPPWQIKTAAKIPKYSTQKKEISYIRDLLDLSKFF